MSLKTQSKVKKPLEIPAMDHTKQRAKLQDIIQLTENAANIGLMTTPNFPNVNRSQVFPKGIHPQTMTNFVNQKASKNNLLVSSEDQKSLDRKRKKVMSHQAAKAATQSQSVERIMEERQELEDGTEEEVKKPKVRGSQSNIRSNTSRSKLEMANLKK